MKKICFVTTISGTITAFLTDYAKYLVEKHGYDVTFICDNDKAMYDYCSNKIHYIPVSMRRGVNLDIFKVTWQLRKIFKQEKFKEYHSGDIVSFNKEEWYVLHNSSNKDNYVTLIYKGNQTPTTDI